MLSVLGLLSLSVVGSEDENADYSDETDLVEQNHESQQSLDFNIKLVDDSKQGMQLLHEQLEESEAVHFTDIVVVGDQTLFVEKLIQRQFLFDSYLDEEVIADVIILVQFQVLVVLLVVVDSYDWQNYVNDYKHYDDRD